MLLQTSNALFKKSVYVANKIEFNLSYLLLNVGLSKKTIKWTLPRFLWPRRGVRPFQEALLRGKRWFWFPVASTPTPSPAPRCPRDTRRPKQPLEKYFEIILKHFFQMGKVKHVKTESFFSCKKYLIDLKDKVSFQADDLNLESSSDLS